VTSPLRSSMKNIVSIILVLVLAGFSSATIINIPADYPTIQQGIDASADGDTVLVQPGTYYENIDFNGHNIVLGSLFLTTGDIMYIPVTVIRGTGWGTVVIIGSGENQNTMLTGFTVTNGDETSLGGGIRIQDSNPAIIFNAIIGNTAFVWDASSYGGGIYCNNSNPLIMNNIIADNFAGAGGHGNPQAYGAGIFCSNSNGTIRNNTICGNRIFSGYGSGLYIINSNTIFFNNIFWGNDLGSGHISGDSVDMTYSNIEGGFPGIGNIELVPLFIDARLNNYNICSQSPCIDAGDPTIIDPDGSPSDIGVYYPSHPNCFVGNKWYISPLGDDSTGNGSIGDPFRTIQHGINIAIPGDSIIAENGIYEENINIYFKEVGILSRYIYSSDFNDISNTIIDGNAAGSVISVRGCDTSTAVIGFTIRNGLAGDGGGLLVQNSKLIISNNIITENATTYNFGFGGGINCRYSDCTISQNLIYRNFAYSWGGGISLSGSNALILNNTICHNGRSTGGILCGGSNALIINNIIWGNALPQIEVRGPPFPTVSYSDIEGGYAGIGNIESNPLFIDPHSGNYNVCNISPCIDAGDPTLFDPDSTRSDMGVFFPSHSDCLEGNVWYVSITGDDSTGDGSQANPWRTIQHGVDMSFPSDTIIAEQGTYVENISMFNKNITLASNFIYTGDSLDIINTIIDGDSVSSTITLEYCDNSTSIIGITISRGIPSGIYNYLTNAQIGFNIIRNNYGNGIACSRAGPTIFGNFIFNNINGSWGGGIGCGTGSRPIILNNIIYGNEAIYGAGVCCRSSVPILYNNIIFGNSAETGGGFYNYQSTYYIRIFNSIIRGNYPSDIVNIPSGALLINHSNIQGGWPGTGNIDVDPLFRNPAGGDFHLMSVACGDSADSPCIDAGDPNILDSLLDCSWGLGGPRSDMGAYGGGDSLITGIFDNMPFLPDRFLLLQNYPNPFNARTTISFILPQSQNVQLTVYDLLGRKVETLIDEEKQAGQHQAVWDASGHSSGVYFYRIESGDYTDTRKMILLK